MKDARLNQEMAEYLKELNTDVNTNVEEVYNTSDDLNLFDPDVPSDLAR